MTVFSVKMPWTKRREAREAAELAERIEREARREQQLARLRSTLLAKRGGVKRIGGQGGEGR